MPGSCRITGVAGDSSALQLQKYGEDLRPPVYKLVRLSGLSVTCVPYLVVVRDNFMVRTAVRGQKQYYCPERRPDMERRRSDIMRHRTGEEPEGGLREATF